jgi:hypothetical protein
LAEAKRKTEENIMKKPTAFDLSRREPALLALLVGSVAAQPHGDFGHDIDDGSDASFGGEYDMGYEFGYAFGDDAPSAAALPPAAVQSIVRSHVARMRKTAERESLIQPNKGSAVNIEGYEFAVNSTLTLGAAAAFSDSNSPDVNLKTRRITANAPSVGFARFSDIKVANVSAIVGGNVDAFNYSAQSVGHEMNLPLLTPSNKARVSGTYSGLPIAGLATYELDTGFSGPATMAA